MSASAAECAVPAIDAPHATAVIYNPSYPNSHSTSHGHADRIWLDEKLVCRLDVKRYVIIPLSPGVHSLRSSNKDSGVKLDFKTNAIHYYRMSYDDSGWIVYTSLQPAPPESLAYDLQRMKPAKGETKPLPNQLDSSE